MKETRFIAQNKEKWREAETLLQSPVKDPEKLSNLFTQVVDDLSYSRTYYPNRSVRVYLNKIARQFFSIIYSYRKEKRNQFKLFWLDELPQILLYSRRQLLISFLVFLLALAIGVFSAYNDPQFVNTILGDDYVSMTEKNIQGGDPMAVYKQSHEVDMFLGITFNNLMVAFRTYVLGIFMGIGTLGSLLHNGIMVGCFQYYFVDKGLFMESAVTIWLHGTLEISSIVLAGAAGLTLGSGLIFPGTYSRLQSLQISGIRSLKFMLGVSPIFVLAAIIESFLTRYTEAPLILKLFLIGLSAVFIIGYFVIYPWHKAKSGFEVPLKEIRLASTGTEETNFRRIKNNADLLKDTFQFYSRYNGRILPWVFYVSISLALFNLVFEGEQFSYFVETEWWLTLLTDMFAALQTPSLLSVLINSLATSLILYKVMELIRLESKKEELSQSIKSFLQLFLLTAIIYTAIYLGPWGIVLLIPAFGLLLFISFVQLVERGDLLYSIGQGFDLFRKNQNQGISLQLMSLLLSASFLLVLTAPLLYIHMNIIEWNFAPTDIWAKKVIRFFELFVQTFSFYLVLPILAASLSYLYFSQEEVNNAAHLKESISKLGVRMTKGKKR